MNFTCSDKFLFRCNAGYEFAGDSPNNYETCGPSTDFNWSFEMNNIIDDLDPTEARINDCIGSVFSFLTI